MRRIMALVTFAATRLLAQQGVCDPGLPQPANDPYGYKQRGDRCEGQYIRQVAGSSSITVASFTRAFENYDLTSGKDLRLDWDTPPASQPVHLRGIGLRQRFYYRMDTVRPPTPTAYLWNTEVLTGLRVTTSELGLLAWVSMPVGTANQDVYLPLKIGSAAPGYRVTLSPGEEVGELWYGISPAGSDGRIGKALFSNKPLEGYYPAGRAITVPISNPGPAGFYVVDISATLKPTGATKLQLWFYHSGK